MRFYRLFLWLQSPKFPAAQVKKILVYKPEGFSSKVRNIFRTWVVHPVKRRAARLYVRILQKVFGLRVIGITGSSGKTTVKEMLASILKKKGETVYSPANIDPVYNIPTTILKCKPSTKYLVLEMGVEYPNEMDFYLWLARPEVGIITNIYPTHTLFFKNIEGVFKEKSKLAKGLSEDGVGVLNIENDFLNDFGSKVKTRVFWFGDASGTYASNVKFSNNFKTNFDLHLPAYTLKIGLPVLGRQFVSNALAAAAAANALGINNNNIKSGLESFKNQEHRMSIKKLKSGVVLIDDTYNNNPEAAKKAIETLKEFAGKRKTMLIFGDMLELGKREVSFHKEIGVFIRTEKLDYVIGVGPLSENILFDKKNWAVDWESAVPIAKRFLARNMVVLVKGSRSVNLDKLVDKLK